MTTIRLDDDVNEPYQARTVPKPAVGPERSVSTAVRRASSNIMSFTAGLAAGFTSNMYTSEEDQPRGSADLSMGGLYSAESMFQNDDFSSNGGNTSSKAGPAPSSAKPQFAQLPELATTIPPDVELQCVAWKQCPTVALLWQERFLVMKNDGTIHYYESREAYIHRFAPKGVIALRDVQQNEFARNGVYDSVAIFQNRLNIHVNSKNNRVYKLKFATAEEAAQWKQAIGKYLDMFFNR